MISVLFALTVASLLAALAALAPTALFCANLRKYLPPPAPPVGAPPAHVSVLIPARDEELSIEAAVQSALASSGAAIEVIVMNDGSTDRTAAIVESLQAEDPRVQLRDASPLPRGWTGKQHACWALAHAAGNDILCFVDADVRLESDAIQRMAVFLDSRDAALVSGFPRQITTTPLEWLLLPMIHFVLLGFLPLDRMRAGADPAFAAGCGQVLMVRRDAYFAAGGHAAIRETMHDGLRLPKLLRQHGHRTDLADLTSLARCRMYTTAGQVWQGLAKNAIEGLGAPARIVPISLLLLLGQVVPFVLAGWLLLTHTPVRAEILVCTAIAVVAAWLPRVLATARFQQPLQSAVLHPVGIVLLLAIQWYALARKLLGGSVHWRNRAYAND